MSGPPAHPKEGDSWGVYRFQAGKGWVDKRIYQPPVPVDEDTPPEQDFTSLDLSITVRTATAESLFRYAKAGGFTPVEILAKAVEAMLTHDLFAKVLGNNPRKRMRSAVPASPAPTCDQCGGPRSVISSTGLCRPCYWASRRKPKANPVMASCSVCGGPRSPQGRTGKCRTCFTAEQARTVRPVKPIRHCACGAVIGECSKSCRACYEAGSRAKAEGKRQERGQLIAAREERRAAAAPVQDVRPIPEPMQTAVQTPEILPVKAPPPPPVPVAPLPPTITRRAAPVPVRLPVRAEPDDGDDLMDEVRLRAARHAAERAGRVEVSQPKEATRPPDPFAKRERYAETQQGPAFSPEFLAQLAKVKAGAGIAKVAKVPGRFVEGGSGSSLGDVV